MKHHFMKKSIMCVLVLWAAFACSIMGATKNALRPSAYPLITIDPYTSGWAFNDRLYDDNVRHWTGRDFPLMGAIIVDGKAYRFMGKENPKIEMLAAPTEAGAWPCRYTFDRPERGWEKPEFDDSKWKSGSGAFGNYDYPQKHSEWDTEHIWLRRTVMLNEDVEGKRVILEYSHDDDAVFYVNGIRVVDTGDSYRMHQRLVLEGEALASLKPGRNVIAATCLNRHHGAFLDFSLEVESLDGTYARVATQKSVDVQATQTHYTFNCGVVQLNLTFCAPLLMDDLELVSRPVNYINYEVTSRDGKEHDVQVVLEAGPEWCVDSKYQSVEQSVVKAQGLTLLKQGNKQQNVLARKGDDIRIDWGYFYLGGNSANTQAAVRNGMLFMKQNLGKGKQLKGYAMLGYDDIYSIQYFETNLHAYWNRSGKETIEHQFELAAQQHDALMKRCQQFDEQLMAETEAAGGREYAELCALAYRQAISAHKLVLSPSDEVLWLSKENFSNGSIGTVDVSYPSVPLFLVYNDVLAEGLMNHIFDYSEHKGWTKDFPAHDTGTYPISNGQTYGGDMPVEEGGNMLLMAAAVCKSRGNADYAKKHWKSMTTWVKYLERYGLDPEDQLCTDDFAGRFAHNTNLSIKAILGLAAYGYMAGLQGNAKVEKKYMAMAREMAMKWEQMANEGDHYRLCYDRPGTWSQKYNLVWDKLFGWNIFPEKIAKTEIAYYLEHQNRYGLPLDSRKEYTKTDWVCWTATLADSQQDFEELISPIYCQVDETSSRIPMSDWVWTTDGKQTAFQARSVVGGYFIKQLEKRWKK